MAMCTLEVEKYLLSCVRPHLTFTNTLPTSHSGAQILIPVVELELNLADFDDSLSFTDDHSSASPCLFTRSNATAGQSSCCYCISPSCQVMLSDWASQRLAEDVNQLLETGQVLLVFTVMTTHPTTSLQEVRPETAGQQFAKMQFY